MKKGRHRRFEEARKLKQQGPGAFLGLEPREHDDVGGGDGDGDGDDYADIAERYGAFDDDEDDDGS
ncbi:MAG: hypothetical protein ACRD0G_10455 [Acidimicrobiales bacterium]